MWKGFYDWFYEHKVDSIVSGMLTPVQEEAGLWKPPEKFTTNASEYLLKRKMNLKKNELPTLVNLLRELVDEQDREVERVIIGRRKYQFRKEFQYLKIAEADWFLMTRE